MKFKGYKVIFLYVILLCILMGCKSNDNQSKIETKDKAPDSLNDLAGGMDEILSSVGNIERLTLELPVEDKGDESKNKPQGEKASPEAHANEGEESSTEGQNGPSGEGGSGGGSNSSGSSESEKPTNIQEKKEEDDLKKDEETKKFWDEISKKLDEIHPMWNSFEAEGIKKGATKEMGDKFESNFNKMTKAIEIKNIIEIYNYGAESFLSLKPLFDLYIDEIGGDASVIKYSTYKAYTEALKGNNKESIQLLTGREENINKIRLKMTDDKEKEQVEKINMALADFKNSLAENSRMLFMIKKDIIIQNLKELE